MAVGLTTLESQMGALGHCERTESGLLKCTRYTKDGGRQPIAIYWVDATGSLPTSPESLVEYQRRLFGREYYELPRSLQLNHYLLFITDAAEGEVSEVRSLIEEDISYARKFVLDTPGFERFLSNLQLAFGIDKLPPAPTETWEQLLDAQGLSALYGERARTAVIRDIEQGVIGPEAIKERRIAGKVVTRKAKAELTALPFIKSIVLTNFGVLADRNLVSLGRVTLLAGPNGAGKTTVLEGLEFAFCGRNHGGERVVAEGEPEAHVVFQGQDVPVRFGTSNQERLDLDLSWFGGYARRDAKLEKSFNRYVFFNADSAFALEYSDDQQQVSDAINRLALGEEANRVWGEIVAYEDAIKKAHAQRKNQWAAARDTQRSIEELAKNLQNPIEALPQAFKRAVAALGALRFSRIPASPQEFSSDLLGLVVKLSESLQSAASWVAWLPNADPEAIERRTGEIASDLDKLQVILDDLARQTKDKESAASQVKEARRHIQLLERYKIYVRLDWRATTQRIAALEAGEKVTGNLNQLAGQYGETTFSDLDLSLTVSEALNTTLALERGISAQLSQTRAQLENLQRSLSEKQSVIADIRGLANHWLTLEQDPKHCPVCASIFASGDLRKRIEAQIEQTSHDEGQVSRLQNELQLLNRQHTRVMARLEGVRVLKQAEEIVGSGKSIRTTLAAIQTRLIQGNDDARRLAALRTHMRDLAAQGLDDLEFRELDRKIDLAKTKRESEKGIQAEIDRLNAALDLLVTKLAAVEKKITNLERDLNKIRAAYAASDVDVSDIRRHMQEMRSRAEKAGRALEEASAAIRIPKNQKLKDLVLAGLIARDAVRDFSAIQEQEQKRQAEFARITKQLEKAAEEQGQLAKIVVRLDLALKAVREIQRHHSLDDLGDAFFEENLQRINTVFRMIHSPQEFESVCVNRGDDGKGLKVQLLKKDGRLVDVRQISTGQRAALALSIFFVLNEKLQVGPQLILLDDPVAHVDDLNALAFFDYLREVALTGKRQIIYATANEKMAMLLENKMAFLKKGKDLVVHQLSTDAPALAS